MKGKENKAYPYNLLEEVFANKEYEPAELTDDMADGLAYAIAALGERREAILRMYYAEGKRAREIADYFGVSVEYLNGEEETTKKPLSENEEWLDEVYNMVEDLSESEKVAFKSFIAGLKANRKP